MIPPVTKGPARETCPACDGTGKAHADPVSPAACTLCQGYGEFWAQDLGDRPDTWGQPTLFVLEGGA